jgi:hypothetical protein
VIDAAVPDGNVVEDPPDAPVQRLQLLGRQLLGVTTHLTLRDALGDQEGREVVGEGANEDAAEEPAEARVSPPVVERDRDRAEGEVDDEEAGQAQTVPAGRCPCFGAELLPYSAAGPLLRADIVSSHAFPRRILGGVSGASARH